MVEVLIAGAGPAGSVAAALLARRGARVLLVDRATFPRDKLCGDTLNPGALALLRRLGLWRGLEERALAIDGMKVTGPNGASVRARYREGLTGRAILRRDLDAALVEAARQAGAHVEEGVRVLRPLVDSSRGGPVVRGAVLAGRDGRTLRVPACVTIACDGRRSALAVPMGLLSHPRTPRRWAVGAYFEGVAGLESCGEMHLRDGHYIGVAPVPGGLTNACLVTGARRQLRDPQRLLSEMLAADPTLRDRFAAAKQVSPPVMLGPLAVDARAAGMPGLLLAGDAAGFIDPMTGDGLRLAIHGAVLAADTALRLLDAPYLRGPERLARLRLAAFGPKLRLNRVLRRLAGSPAALHSAARGARWLPWVVEWLVDTAGDVTLAQHLERAAPPSWLPGSVRA